MRRIERIIIALLLIALMWVWNPSLLMTILDGFSFGSKIAIASESDITTANIKKAVDLSSVTDTYEGARPCSGTLNGTRWCDNGDGTVTDLITGLVWLQKADWGGRRKIYKNDENAHDRVSSLKAGATDANLTDGSVEGDWRLTLSELKGLTSGDEAVSSSQMRAFTGVQSSHYWSSSTNSSGTALGWHVSFGIDIADIVDRAIVLDVWPVRDGK